MGKEENMDREEIKMLVKKWWEIYEDESLDYKRRRSAATITNKNILAGEADKITAAASSEAGIVHYITAPSAA